MNDSRELTLQERSTKRANYCLMLTVLIISIYMMFLFIGTILQGNHALFRLFVIAGMIALPAAVSTLFYFFNPVSIRYRNVALTCFLIIYEVSCLSSKLFVYNLFMIPILVALLMYFDLKLEICAGVLNMVCCIFKRCLLCPCAWNQLSFRNQYDLCDLLHYYCHQHNHLPGVPRGRPAQHRGARRTGSP